MKHLSSALKLAREASRGKGIRHQLGHKGFLGWRTKDLPLRNESISGQFSILFLCQDRTRTALPRMTVRPQIDLPGGCEE